jgi:hypothetical protein
VANNRNVALKNVSDSSLQVTKQTLIAIANNCEQ